MSMKTRESRNAYARAWRAKRSTEQRLKHRAYFRKRARVKRYGILDATDETKVGKCPICGRDEQRPLHYDHDHATGKFRGWICHWCNSKLGWFEKYRSEIESYLGKPLVQ